MSERRHFGRAPQNAGLHDGHCAERQVLTRTLFIPERPKRRPGDETMQNFLTRLWNDESGQDLIEYAVLLGLITIAVILIITTLGGTIENLFSDVNDRLESIPAGS